MVIEAPSVKTPREVVILSHFITVSDLPGCALPAPPSKFFINAVNSENEAHNFDQLRLWILINKTDRAFILP